MLIIEGAQFKNMLKLPTLPLHSLWKSVMYVLDGCIEIRNVISNVTSIFANFSRSTR